MGDILGVGPTHYPSIIAPDEDRAFPLTRTLRTNDRIPLALKHPSSWIETYVFNSDKCLALFKA